MEADPPILAGFCQFCLSWWYAWYVPVPMQGYQNQNWFPNLCINSFSDEERGGGRGMIPIALVVKRIRGLNPLIFFLMNSFIKTVVSAFCFLVALILVERWQLTAEFTWRMSSWIKWEEFYLKHGVCLWWQQLGAENSWWIPPRPGDMGRDGETVMGSETHAVLILSQQENHQEAQKDTQRCKWKHI